MLDAFAIINLILTVLQIVLLAIFTKMRRHQGAKQQIVLLGIAIVSLLLRAFWYEMSKYYYYDDFPVKTLQTINAVQLTLMIFEQCVYIQSWFKVILVFSHMRGEKAVKIAFPILYLSISLISVAAILWRICSDAHDKGQDEFNAYDLCMKIVCTLSLLVALVYLVVGSIILVKLRGFYELCSRTVMQFLVVGILFLVSSLMRFISLLHGAEHVRVFELLCPGHHHHRADQRGADIDISGPKKAKGL